PDAFAAFYDRHAESVLAFFARRTADPEAAADLTAETFTAALTSLARFDPEQGVPAAWLYGIAHHLLSRWLRRQELAERHERRIPYLDRLRDELVAAHPVTRRRRARRQRLTAAGAVAAVLVVAVAVLGVFGSEPASAAVTVTHEGDSIAVRITTSRAPVDEVVA